ncbi:unnamed protein product [Arabis nemorensis]|uniref:Glutaredoxin domain-containing protein n=1 Tax=Arabis nemorensis TaxID=586526 RepID=A0A565CC72_9BRAS|nr:unnamed protein product [Arabis nemorensis]
MEESVKKTVTENTVVVYSKTWCSYCTEVKTLFKRLGVQPLVIELDELGPQGPQLQKVLGRLTGQHTVPNVFVGGKHIGGCTDTVKLNRKGDLELMLAEANVVVENLQRIWRDQMATLVSSQTYIYHCYTRKRALDKARRFSRHSLRERRDFSPQNPRFWPLTITTKHQPLSFSTVCSAADEPSSSSSSEISADARIRSEVLTPFRSVRMFFYLAFIASASLGGLIATSRLIGALANPARSGEVLEILKGLGIDVGAASLFAFLYFRENKTKNAQMARLSREENLAKLKMRVEENNKVISVGDLRGVARLVICAGPAEYIEEAFKRSREFTQGLVERGVVVVAYATDGKSPVLEFDETDIADEEMSQRRRRLWRVAPVFVSEWDKWLDEQKKLAGVSSDSPVYLSLRLDGRVRGSGVGYPPWQAFVAQLPPVKGIWTGLLDGMDGRV